MKYGSIGQNMTYSYSKIIHEALGAYPYELRSLEPEELNELLQNRDFNGLSVTIPYKKTVIPYCDHLSQLAAEIGAVNCLYFDENHELHGTNTDYTGFLYAIDTAGISVRGKKVVILGNGATCQTIKKAVTDRGASELVIASRKAAAPTEMTVGSCNCLMVNYEDLSDHADAEIVINATPVGMYPGVSDRLIDLRAFPCCKGVFDVIYNPYYTALVKQAVDLNISFASGLSMLVAQATAAAGYFTGKGSFYEKENERIISMLKREFVQNN